VGDVPERDADATRKRLIDAATAEFARYGIAGARVDRIAANGRANKAQIYHYFGSKDRLFDAVWEALVTRIAQAAALDPTDLIGFAVRLSDIYAEQPDLMRLITWQRLERADDLPHSFAMSSIQNHIDAITKAQTDGIVPDRFNANFLYALLLHSAAVWAMMSPDVLAVLDINDPEERRQLIEAAVRPYLD
jgi:AcrR family transcriptional regulator